MHIIRTLKIHVAPCLHQRVLEIQSKPWHVCTAPSWIRVGGSWCHGEMEVKWCVTRKLSLFTVMSEKRTFPHLFHNVKVLRDGLLFCRQERTKLGNSADNIKPSFFSVEFTDNVEKNPIIYNDEAHSRKPEKVKFSFRLIKIIGR